MTFSPLTKRVIAHRNKYSSRGGLTPSRLIAHHWAGIYGGIERMENPNEEASTNYLILTNGDLVGQVPEEFRAWTSGSPGADNPSITVEVQNSSTHVALDKYGRPDNMNPNSWPVSAAAFATLCALLADLHKRYKWGDLEPSRLRGHQEFASTACPGGYLWSRLPLVREGAADIINGKTEPEKKPDEDIEMRTIYNTNDKNENTRRATVGEFTFHVQRSAVNTRERKLWAAPVNVSQGEWDAILATVNSRRQMIGLEPLKGTYNEFYNPAAGDVK